MDTTTHIKGQLLGYKKLPEQSGLWGVLLPRPGEKAVAHEPDAQDVVQRLDDSCLVFENAMHAGNRGFLFAFCLPFALVLLQMLPMLFKLGGAPTALIAFASLVLFAFIFIPLLIAYRSARNPLTPPVYLSRIHRKVYAWSGRIGQWLALDYDTLVPATFVRKVITPSGAATVYLLTLNQLRDGGREIEYSVAPAPARGHPEHCGAIWEYIRRYMDGPPEGLPAVRLVPSLVNQPSAWMARTDRTIFTDFIDDEHRVKRSVFAMSVVWFWGSLGYWWERAAGWIERTAPIPALPQELDASLKTANSAMYRVTAFTEIQLQAQAGTLTHMRVRWLICGVVGSLIWGGLFALLTASIWVAH